MKLGCCSTLVGVERECQRSVEAFGRERVVLQAMNWRTSCSVIFSGSQLLVFFAMPKRSNEHVAVAVPAVSTVNADYDEKCFTQSTKWID